MGELCSADGECVSADESNLCAHALYEAIYGPDYPLEVTGSMADDVVGNCGNGTSTGGDADFRWFPIRGGEYRLTAHAENAGENVSLAIYDDCGSGNTTTERVCENRWSNADEVVELTVDIAVSSVYRVVERRGFNSDGDITLTIECISGGCLTSRQRLGSYGNAFSRLLRLPISHYYYSPPSVVVKKAVVTPPTPTLPYEPEESLPLR